ncbi:MAG TPA: polysaccharide biosynthesis C-terminal domain-containing protein [Isosphaeraceae bacterium]
MVIGAFLDIGAIPYYSVANSLAVYFMDFIVAIAAVVMPMTSRLEAGGDFDGLRVMFLKWSKITFSISLMGGLFLLVLGPRFLAWWIDRSFERSGGDVLRILILSHVVFLPMRGMALPVLMGLGTPGPPTVAFLVAGLFNLGVSIFLVRPYGLAGVVWSTAIANVLFAVALLRLTCRELGIPIRDDLGYVGLRPLIGSAPVLGLLLGFLMGLDDRGPWGLLAVGLAMTAVFALVWSTFVNRNDRYVRLRFRLKKLIP